MSCKPSGYIRLYLRLSGEESIKLHSASRTLVKVQLASNTVRVGICDIKCPIWFGTAKGPRIAVKKEEKSSLTPELPAVVQ